jgi:LPXTG-motif cell wall-anchored protein
MKRCFLFFIHCFFIHYVTAQYVVQTIVPQKNVTPGAAFQVQYIVEKTDNFLELKTPDFGPQFKLISGPRIYPGISNANKRRTAIQNFTYTLIPLIEGSLVIKGATAIYKDAVLKSNDVPLLVLEGGQTGSNAAQLQAPVFSPRSLEEKISEYLFIRTEIDKRETFVGQPIVATFTLYSRLESISEVIKNPGFYGFSVVEIPAPKEAQQAIKLFKGNLYNTHIIRKLQLYPLQSGILEIDEMILNNKIAYKDSATALFKMFETAVASEKGTITIKPLPEQPAQFTGAVGKFSIAAGLVTTKMPLNREGQLKLTITGSGNFMELTAPAIKWPGSITGFEAKEKDSLQKDKVPVTGSKIYSYNFTADSAGQYTFEPIQFSYFDPQEKKYKTLSTTPLNLQVGPKEKSSFLTKIKEKSAGKKNSWLLYAGALVVFVSLFLFFYKRKRKPLAQTPLAGTTNYQKKLAEIKEDGNKEGYQQVQQLIIAMVLTKYSLQTTGNKERLLHQMKEGGADESIKKKMAFIINECEAVLYYNAEPSISFAQLKKETDELIMQVEL